MIRNIIVDVFAFAVIGLLLGLLVEYWLWAFALPLPWFVFGAMALAPLGVLAGFFIAPAGIEIRKDGEEVNEDG